MSERCERERRSKWSIALHVNFSVTLPHVHCSIFPLPCQCTVDACVPSDAKECACKDILPKDKSCSKCEVMKAVKAGKCAGVKTCSPMSASDCPKVGEPNCPPCQKAVVSKGKSALYIVLYIFIRFRLLTCDSTNTFDYPDACGCPKLVCQKAQCAKLSKKLINCEKNGKFQPLPFYEWTSVSN